MTNNYTDTQLKQVLAKMLPNKVNYINNSLHWYVNNELQEESTWTCRDTELFYLCWLVEKRLTEQQADYYINDLCCDEDETKYMWFCIHATWQQRTIALAKVLNIEIL